VFTLGYALIPYKKQITFSHIAQYSQFTCRILARIDGVTRVMHHSTLSHVHDSASSGPLLSFKINFKYFFHPIIETIDGKIIFLTLKKKYVYYLQCEPPTFSLDLALVHNVCSKLIKKYLNIYNLPLENVFHVCYLYK
jgi:hypothetical protein